MRWTPGARGWAPTPPQATALVSASRCARPVLTPACLPAVAAPLPVRAVPLPSPQHACLSVATSIHGARELRDAACVVCHIRLPNHRQATHGCSASGSRDPAADVSCSGTVPCHMNACPSGYCECAGGKRKHPVDCHPGSHQAFSCDAVCAEAEAAAAGAGTSWSTSCTVAPNNRNFPSSGLVTGECPRGSTCVV